MFSKLFHKPAAQARNEMILSQNISLNMDSRVTRRNCNVFVVGSPQAPIKQSYILPNLLQHNCSYVVIDTDGSLKARTEQTFKDNGYEIKVLDGTCPKKTLHYNPFHYIRDDKDLLTMVNVLGNSLGERRNVHGDSDLSDWLNARLALLQATVFYLYHNCIKADQNLFNIVKVLKYNEDQCDDTDLNENIIELLADITKKYLELINTMQDAGLITDQEDTDFHDEFANDDEESESILDILFKHVREEDPESFAVQQYQIYNTFKKQWPEEAAEIVSDIRVTLAILLLSAHAYIAADDEIDIASIGLKPTILYIRSALNDGILPLFFTQLFDTLSHVAETQCKYFLPIHVRVLLDKMYTYGVIPDLTDKLAAMRLKHISCDILIENFAEFKRRYPDDWEYIVSNCDSLIYLADENDVPEFISHTFLPTHPNIKGISKKKAFDTPANIRKGAKPLTSSDQLTALKKGDCAVQIRGCVPLIDEAYDACQIDSSRQGPTF